MCMPVCGYVGVCVGVCGCMCVCMDIAAVSLVVAGLNI